MTVKLYDREFDMLSHFAPKLLENEATRAGWFIKGLRLDLHDGIQNMRSGNKIKFLS